MKGLFRGLVPVCRKEFLHIVRDPGTLFFALLIPILQLVLIWICGRHERAADSDGGAG
jgi:hypothetical protein